MLAHYSNKSGQSSLFLCSFFLCKFFFQRGLDLAKAAHPFFGDLRILRIHILQCAEDDLADDIAHVPFVICRYDLPGAVLRGSLVDGILKGLLISIPVTALLVVGSGELPVFLRLLDAVQETFGLLFF